LAVSTSSGACSLYALRSFSCRALWQKYRFDDRHIIKSIQEPARLQTEDQDGINGALD